MSSPFSRSKSREALLALAYFLVSSSFLHQFVPVHSFVVLNSTVSQGAERQIISPLDGEKVIGGVETEEGEFPALVTITFDSVDANGKVVGRSMCGGNIINQHWVLTAGHCSEGPVKSYIILAGAHNLHDTKDPYRVEKRVVQIITHYNFIPELFTKGRDVALLRVRTPFVFNERVGPSYLVTDYNPPYGDVISVGRGLTIDTGSISPVPNKVTIPSLTLEECRRRYGMDVSDDEVCAGGRTLEGSCNGDSGGPLYTRSGYLLGITSYGPNHCTIPGIPSVYAQIPYHAPWIQDVCYPDTAVVPGSDLSVYKSYSLGFESLKGAPVAVTHSGLTGAARYRHLFVETNPKEWDNYLTKGSKFAEGQYRFIPVPGDDDAVFIVNIDRPNDVLTYKPEGGSTALVFVEGVDMTTNQIRANGYSWFFDTTEVNARYIIRNWAVPKHVLTYRTTPGKNFLILVDDPKGLYSVGGANRKQTLMMIVSIVN